MPKVLEFYNVKTKKRFRTGKYKVVRKKGRRFAVTMNAGIKVYRIIGK